jgi:hypothetical protein
MPSPTVAFAAVTLALNVARLAAPAIVFAGTLSASEPQSLTASSLPERVGDFRRGETTDLADSGVKARYSRGEDWADVSWYRAPSTGTASAHRRLTLHEEAQLCQEALLELQGKSFERIELVDAEMPLAEDVNGRAVQGLLFGAAVIAQGRAGSTYTILFDLGDHHLKIQLTFRDRLDVSGAAALGREVLRAVISNANPAV